MAEQQPTRFHLSGMFVLRSSLFSSPGKIWGTGCCKMLNGRCIPCYQFILMCACVLHGVCVTACELCMSACLWIVCASLWIVCVCVFSPSATTSMDLINVPPEAVEVRASTPAVKPACAHSPLLISGRRWRLAHCWRAWPPSINHFCKRRNSANVHWPTTFSVISHPLLISE